MNRTITIAGGGLAGLSLGIALRRRDVPVRVIEAASYPRHRVCGEFISGIKVEELDALGIRDLFANAARNSSTAWFDREKEMLRAHLPVEALGISRHFLDAELARRFENLGGELRTSTRWQDEGDGVVWASGRHKRESEWLGLKAHYEQLDLAADLEVHLGDSAYIGMTRIEGGRVNVCGLFRRSEAITRSEQNGNALLVATQEAGFTSVMKRLRGASVIAGSIKGVSHFSLGWQAAETDRLFIGDAAAMIPPFTGNGMTMALQGALAAVEPLRAWSAGQMSWRETREMIADAQGTLFGGRLLSARVMQSVLMRGAGRRLVALLMRAHLIRFESLYHTVR